MTQTLIVVLVVILAGAFVRSRLRKVVIFEFERGLLYADGVFQAVIEPGSRWVWIPSRTITKVDIRPRVTTVPSQEVLSRDGIAVKASLLAEYAIERPDVAINRQASFEAALYAQLQLALRQIIASETIDSLLEGRGAIGPRLTELSAPKASELGLSLTRVDVKDLTLPGELKKLFAQVTKARQEGLAALERARGETAALRNLSNAARLVSDNPALMQLRLLQVVGEQSGNTVVLGMPSSSTPIPVPTQSRERIEAPPPDAPEA